MLRERMKARRLSDHCGRVKARRRSDRGDSTLVTLVFVLPIFFAFLVTTIDTGIYFNNRSIVQAAARDGARTIAIFGGNGSGPTPGGTESPLEASYGNNQACAQLAANTTDTGAKSFAVSSAATPVECQVWGRLLGIAITSSSTVVGTSPLTNVQVTNVACGPPAAGNVGAATYCNIDWKYNGIPGSTMSFIKSASGTSPFYDNHTGVTSQSEVSMAGVTYVTRN